MKYALIYLGTFLTVQSLMAFLAAAVIAMIFPHSGQDQEILKIILGSVLYSVATLTIFLYAKWCPVSCDYIKTKPFAVLATVFVISIAITLPSLWYMEQLPDYLTKDLMAETFEKLLKRPEGYIVVGIAAPIVEEIVFRGAILRKLLEWMENSFGELTRKKVWIAIAISATMFSAIHMNPAQMPNAFLIGLLLGWLYYHTDSVIPGIIYHWTNNTIPFIMLWAFPEVKYDAKLIDYFNGNETAMIMAVVTSVLVAIPLLWQLNRLIKK